MDRFPIAPVDSSSMTAQVNEPNLVSIISAIPTTAWVTRPDGYVDYFNERWLSYAGMTAEEALGWGWAAALHPDDAPRLVEYWRSRLASGLPVDTEARLRRFDGEYRWFLFRANPLRDASDAIVRWYGTNIDIEDRKRAEQALQANERNLVSIINTIPTMAWSANPEGAVDFVNRRWLDYAGTSEEQAEGWAWKSVIHPDDMNELLDQWQSCLVSGTSVNAESRMRRFDGVYRWFAIQVEPFRDETGKIARWYGTSTDIEDRKRSNEALQANERNLASIINTIPTTAWATRADGYCEFLSERWLTYAGMTLEEALGWGWTTVIHPDDAQALSENWQFCLATGIPRDIEARMRRFDGEYRWFIFRASPLRDESGAIVRWFGTNIDIDDRKRADEAQANQRALDLIINTIPALAWSARSDGYVDFLNQRWLDYTGLSVEHALGWQWTIAVHPDDLYALSDHWKSIMASGEPGEVETRFRRFDGTYRWFLIRANALRDDLGNIVKWYGTNTDIDDRKLAEEQLRRSEAFLAEGQHLTKSGSFSWRVETSQIEWSEQLHRIYEFDEAVRITFELIESRVHPDDVAIIHEMLGNAKAAVGDLQYEYRLLMPDGSIRYLRSVAHAIRNQNGVLEYIGAVQDVTQRQLAEDALTRARAELAHVTRVTSLGVLTASIAHEVNQPLTAITTNASTCMRMLANEPPNLDGARETARRIIRDISRASEVIARLRALFSKEDPVSDSVDLNEATRDVIALSLSQIQQARVVLKVELSSDLPYVEGDRVQIQQVILNLLLNALEAMDAVEDRPRLLSVRTEPDKDNGVRLSVKDAGIGISRDGADKLFHAFYTTKSEGMGMGLSVSRSIIEGHRGHIWAEPNDGHGATFFFVIPGSSDLPLDHRSADSSDKRGISEGRTSGGPFDIRR